jgi:hypothetical protein
MSHRYGAVISVRQAGETPETLCWRGTTYRVVEVLATWHLRTRWWEQQTPRPDLREALAPTTTAKQPSDRFYYRLLCVQGLICELFFDAEQGTWVLDRVYD